MALTGILNAMAGVGGYHLQRLLERGPDLHGGLAMPAAGYAGGGATSPRVSATN